MAKTHYSNRLTHTQNKIVVIIFTILPPAIMLFLIGLWAYKQGVFTEKFHLKTTLQSATGIDDETGVFLAGLQIGEVAKIRMNSDGKIEITMNIKEKYRKRIRQDSIVVPETSGLIGKIELNIKGGLKKFPPVKNDAFIESQEHLDVTNIIERLNPLITKAEKIINSFPNQKLNNAVGDLSEITASFKISAVSIEKIMDFDSEKLRIKAVHLLAKLDSLVENVEEISRVVPDVIHKTDRILKHIETIVSRVEVASESFNKALEMNDIIMASLKNIESMSADLAQISPEIKDIVKSFKNIAGGFSELSPQAKIILTDIELVTSELLMIIRGLKSSWPIKNLVPESTEKRPFDAPLSESPYNIEISK